MGAHVYVDLFCKHINRCVLMKGVTRVVLDTLTFVDIIMQEQLLKRNMIYGRPSNNDREDAYIEFI